MVTKLGIGNIDTILEILDTLDISSEGQIMSLLLRVLQVKLFPFLSKVVGQLIMPLPPAMKSTLSIKMSQ